MKTVRITLSYSWDIDEKEWNGLKDWDEANIEKKVIERLSFDPISSFYSLSQIKAPDSGPVEVKLLDPLKTL